MNWHKSQAFISVVYEVAICYSQKNSLNLYATQSSRCVACVLPKNLFKFVKKGWPEKRSKRATLHYLMINKCHPQLPHSSLPR